MTATATPDPTPESNLDRYLHVLRSVSATGAGNPFEGISAKAEEIGAALARMTTATADFVDACRAQTDVGYEDAVDVVQIMAKMLPAPFTADEIDAQAARFVAYLDGEIGDLA